MVFRFLQRLSAFFNGFPIFLNGFPIFLNGFPVFHNGFLIFLNGFPLSEKSKKIYLQRQVYERSPFVHRVSRHLLPELRNRHSLPELHNRHLLPELCNCHSLPELRNRYNACISPNNTFSSKNCMETKVHLAKTKIWASFHIPRKLRHSKTNEQTIRVQCRTN